jgi:ABC-type transport system involved in multi-copper enzyme maturation permease subunit
VNALVRAEFLKVRTTRAIIGYVGVLLILSGFAAAAQASAAHLFELGDSEYQRDLVSNAVAAPLIALLLGIVSVTIEWRHGTITRTFLVTPRRERVLVAKGIAAFLLGIALAVFAVVVVLVVAIPVISGEGTSMDLNGALAGRVGEIVLAVGLWGALGVGFGGLVQNQTAALVGAILWVVVLEPLLGAVLGWAELDMVADALTGRSLAALDGREDEAFSPALGGAIGLAYVALLGTLAWLRIVRQDIT